MEFTRILKFTSDKLPKHCNVVTCVKITPLGFKLQVYIRVGLPGHIYSVFLRQRRSYLLLYYK
jgi:hypothetical protein